MELKKYVRRGTIGESRAYSIILAFDGSQPDRIVLLLEGKARRRVELSASRTLFENYYAVTFLGLEDHLTGNSRKGAVGMYPGAHYVVWEAEDFMSACGVYPELARRAIFELSRRIRIYDARSRVTESEFKQELTIDIGPPQAELTDALYEMSFADEDSFPEHLVKSLARQYEAGQYLMKEGEITSELYIILNGEAGVYQKIAGIETEIAVMKHGDLVGEMAQFDGLPRSADVKALTPLEVLAFQPENFHMLFQLHPRWSMKLMQTLAERIEQRRAMLANLPSWQIQRDQQGFPGG